jgi:hypothetical protein
VPLVDDVTGGDVEFTVSSAKVALALTPIACRWERIGLAAASRHATVLNGSPGKFALLEEETRLQQAVRLELVGWSNRWGLL